MPTDPAPEAVYSLAHKLFTTHAEVTGLCLKEKFDEALVVAETTTAEIVRKFGREHQSYADCVWLVGDVFRARGDCVPAELNYLQAVEIYRRHRADDPKRLAAALACLGELCLNSGDSADAAAFLRESLDAYRDVLTPGAREIQEVRRRLNSIETELNLDALRARVEALRRGRRDRPGATGGVWRRLVGWWTSLSGDESDLVAALVELGRARFAAGDTAGAKASLDEALVAAERAFGGKDRSDGRYVRVLTQIGGHHAGWGNYERAEELFKEALELALQHLGGDHPGTAAVMHEMGGLYASLGQAYKASLLLEEAVKTRRRHLGGGHSETIRSLHLLATQYYSRMMLPQAVQVWGEVFDACPDSPPLDGPDSIPWLFAAGFLSAFVLQELEAGRAYLTRAVNAAVKAHGPDHPSLIQLATVLGLLSARLGDRGQAELMLRHAATLASVVHGQDHPTYSRCLYDWAVWCESVGRFGEAYEAAVRASGCELRNLARLAALMTEAGRREYLFTVERTAGYFAGLVCRHPHPPAGATGAALTAMIQRQGMMTQAAAAHLATARRADDRARSGSPGAGVHASLRGARAALAAVVLRGPGPEGTAEHRRRLAYLQLLIEENDERLPRIHSWANWADRLRSTDHRAIAKALPPGSALVVYARCRIPDSSLPSGVIGTATGRERYAVFVLRAGDPDGVFLADLGDAEQVDRLVDQFRRVLRAGTSGRDLGAYGAEAEADREDGLRLRAAVFDPIRDHLDGHTLFVSTDAHLARLPIGVLPEANGSRLTDHYRISYLSSGGDVLRFGVPAAAPGPALVFADPDYDSGQSDEDRGRPMPWGWRPFGRLPGTRREGEAVAGRLRARLFVGQDATATRLVRECRSPRVLHLATHGFYVPPTARPSDPEDAGGPTSTNPLLRSGLALAGANTTLRGGTPPRAPDAHILEWDTGLFTAEDVLGLDLRGTELVVLSACETGLGDVRTGEGVFGLRSAVAAAGARGLVMSLWAVPDEPTCQLMECFYERLAGGVGPADALAAAQAELRGRYPDPYYWGAFIYQGNPDPVRPCDG